MKEVVGGVDTGEEFREGKVGEKAIVEGEVVEMVEAGGAEVPLELCESHMQLTPDIKLYRCARPSHDAYSR
jgi:hypothetical protein